MPELPTDSTRRLQVLHDYAVLDTLPEATYDDITSLAAEICRTPVALISLIDRDRQWFKSSHGYTVSETPLDHAFCTHLLQGEEVLVVPDATKDERFAEKPSVKADPPIRFYAGAALITPEGERLGSLCVIDHIPREISPTQVRALQVLARDVMAQFELRRRLRHQQQLERRQDELISRLEHARHRLLEAQEVAKIGSWETELSTFAVTWSQETHRIFGTDPATFVPTHAAFLERVHPDDRAAVDEAFRASLVSTEPRALEHRIRMPDGRVKHVEVRWQVFADEHGKPHHAIGTCRDITAQQTSEERERVLNRYNQALLDSSPVAIITYRADGPAVSANTASARVLGAPDLSAILTQNFREHPIWQATGMVATADEALRTGSPQEREVHTINSFGREIWLHCWLSPLTYQEETYLLCYFDDIRERKQAEERILHLRNLARMAGRLARIGAWQIAWPAGHIFWSDELRRLHEVADDYQPDLDTALEFYAPEFRDSVRSAVEACGHDGTPFDFEARLVTAKGRLLWVRVIGEPVRDECGRIVSLQGAFQDITERRQAAEEMRELALRHTTTLESITDALYTLDRDWRITFLNGEAERLLQHPRAELLGRNLWEAFPPAVGTVFDRQFRHALATGEAVSFEEFYPPFGRWFSVRAYPSVQGLAVYFRDVTAARAASESLRRSEERYLLAIHASQAAMWDWDMTTNVILFSPRYRELLGNYTIEEFPDRLETFLAHIHPDDNQTVMQAIERHVASRAHRPSTVEFRIRTKSGGYRWVEASAQAVWNPDGVPIRMVGFTADIHDRRLTVEALRQSEQRFHELANHIGDIFYNYDPVADRLLYINRAFTQIWGRAVEDIQSEPRRYLDFIHPQDRPAVETAFASQLRGEFTDVDFRVIRPDGQIRWVREHAVPIRNAAGTVERIVGTMRDITERRHALERLRQSEERFRLLTKATNDAVWDWDLSTDTVWWSEGFEQLFGHRRHELVPGSKSWIDLIHPDDLDRIATGIQRAIKGTDSEWTDEYRFLRSDGSYIHVSNRGQVIRDDNGRAVRMIGGMSDLTERRQAEAKLREQAALLDQARDAILVRDMEHRVRYWNRGAERLYGWSAEEALSRSVPDLIYRNPGRFTAATAEVIRHGEWSGELEQVTRDGQTITVEARWTLLRDPDGKPRSILAINTDVTQRKKLELQFLRAQRMESIGTLAGGIAHDLNNLLAPITMGVELLRSYDPAPRALPIIDTIERSARRGASLVKQVLSFARGVDGERVVMQVRHVVREVESILENTFPKNITVETDLPPDLWPVTGDPTHLNQVLLNLCVNARDAMPQGGTLRLSARNTEIDSHYAAMSRAVTPGRYVTIEVTDTGHGMTQDVIDRIFEPFFTTKELGRGTGLGLSTVVGIVRSHGGFVNVYSEPGKGSSFVVYLPAHAESESSRNSAHPLSGASPHRGNGEHVLVVDDEANVRDITRATLEAFGYRVSIAEDGARAVSLYARHRDEIAAVITDMMMPVMDGPALITALRHIKPGVLIIAASGLGTQANITKAAQLGVKYFLNKPYSAEQILSTLRSALDEMPDTAEP